MKRNSMFKTFTLLALAFYLSTSIHAQSTEGVKKVKIVKIDEEGNKIVEERIIKGDDAASILDDLDIQVDGEKMDLDLDAIKKELKAAEANSDRVLAKEKMIEMENGKKIVRTITFEKGEDGQITRHEVEEIDGKVTKDDISEASEEDVKNLNGPKEIRVKRIDTGEEHAKGDHKMIIIRKDLEDGSVTEELKWTGEDGEEIDLKDMLKTMEVNVDVDVDETVGEDGNDRKVIIKKRMVVIRIDDLEVDDINTLNKASEAGVSFDDTQSLELNRLEFYPNPNNGQFTLDFQLPDPNAPADIRVMNMTGKEIFNEKFLDPSGAYKKEIDLSNFPGGVYFLSINQSGKQVVKKIVLQ